MIEAIANSGGKLPERQVAMKVALPMLKALSRLHSSGIVHRDIKPEHLMIHNGNLKMGDFGNAGCMYGPISSTTGAVTGAHASGRVSDGKHHQQPFLPVDGRSQHHQHSLSKGDSHPAAVSVTAAAGAMQHGLCLDATPIRDAMNFRTGSIEYMAPEMLDKPTSAEVFHLVSSSLFAVCCFCSMREFRLFTLGRWCKLGTSRNWCSWLCLSLTGGFTVHDGLDMCDYFTVTFAVGCSAVVLEFRALCQCMHSDDTVLYVSRSLPKA